ncbi:unnamed protein product [Caenorhabditis sp. 36 PRJEB53466]|nr:unnamed protein product [Caenorhabditis sp. 36 PRJEB53466]
MSVSASVAGGALVAGSSKSSSTEEPEIILQNIGCLKRLAELDLQPAEKIYTVPNDPGSGGKAVDIQTNVFGIELFKETMVYQYVVHMKADLTTNKEAVFTKKGKEDFIVRDRHKKCCDILFYAVRNNETFFKMVDGNHIVYDGQSCLFATIDLFPEINDIAKKTQLFNINGANIGNEDLKSLSCIVLEIHAAKKESFIISSEKIARRTADPHIRANNRGYTQFMELILNQTCIRDTARFGCFEHGKIFCMKPWDDGYDIYDHPDVGDGKSLLPGLKKTVQYIEGPCGRGQNNPSIVIDAMKTAFHKVQPVLQKVYEILQKDPSNGISDFDKEKVVPVIRGLHCHTTYTDRPRHLRIEGIHHDNAMKARFELKEGGSCTVHKYFMDKYGVQLRYPNANLLICKDRGNNNFYPMELMSIDRDQRVTIMQQTGAQSQKTTRECAVLPPDRQKLIMIGKSAAEIIESNDLLQHFGIKVYEFPMMVKARAIDGNDIQFSERSKAKAILGKWRSPPGSFFKPADWPSVWAFYAVGTSTSRFTPKDLREFSVAFVETCQRKGIRLGQPGECELVSADNIVDKLAMAASCQCKFVFIISDDSIITLHQKFKLLEREYDMIIQDMKMSKALSVIRQQKRLTLENVINKTNVKLGGLNHAVVDSKKTISDDQLIIGVGVSQPVGAARFADGRTSINPLVVGYASNAKACHEFAGDFLLGPNGQDTIASIEDVVRNSMESYEKHRERLPKKVIIYRSGASEGSHASLIAFEVPLARSVVESFKSDIKLIYIVVTKDHSYRFFKQEIDNAVKPTEQNIPAGIVLDTAVTHPACKQFFLNSHSTLQERAGTPLYTVLADDCKAPMDKLEELTYALCHHHQIVALTTSLPTPLYVANECAKRGRNLWAEKTAGKPVDVPEPSALLDRLKDLTMDIAYKYTSNLVDKRVNA